MLDAPLRRVIDPPLARLGRLVVRAGIGADVVTMIGFAAGIGAVASLAFRLDLLALALILINRLLDGLDGAVARHNGATDFGGYLDVVLDFVVYSGVVFGFALGRPDQALPAAFLLFSFVGTGAAFLTYGVMAAKHGMTTSLRGGKAFYYVGGLTEGTETTALLIAICLWPEAFAWLAWGFGALCWITTATRCVAAWQTFR